MSINPKTLDPEDYVAYLIGRIMIEWGELDQRLYHDIGRFDLKMRQTVATYTDDLEIDHRFEHRRKHWRKLCLALSKGNPAVMSAVDREITELKRLEELRSHFAHGQPIWMPNGSFNCPSPHLDILEHRAGTKALRQMFEEAHANQGKFVIRQNILPRFTLSELEKLRDDLTALNVSLKKASETVLPSKSTGRR